jgi:hypothetical protein
MVAMKDDKVIAFIESAYRCRADSRGEPAEAAFVKR